MQTETLVAIIATLVFAMSIRQRVDIHIDRDENSGLGWLLAIIFAAAGIWILSQNGCQLPTLPADIKKAGGETNIKGNPQRKAKIPVDTIIKVPTLERPSMERMKSAYTTLGKTATEIRAPIWVLFLIECQTEAEVWALSNYYSSRNIVPVEMTNGTYWAVIYAPQNIKAEALAEKADWMRHQTEWEKFRLDPTVLNLNDP